MAKLGILTAIIMSGLLLSGCSKGSQPTGNIPTEPTITERVNQFLNDKGITLPAGVERADLKDVANTGGTGVVTQDKKGNTTTYSVIADLPEPTGAAYIAWLKNDSGAVIKLGNLKSEKGGFVVDYSTGSDDSGYKQVVVSKETTSGDAPTTPVLEGSF